MNWPHDFRFFFKMEISQDCNVIHGCIQCIYPFVAGSMGRTSFSIPVQHQQSLFPYSGLQSGGFTNNCATDPGIPGQNLNDSVRIRGFLSSCNYKQKVKGKLFQFTESLDHRDYGTSCIVAPQPVQAGPALRVFFKHRGKGVPGITCSRHDCVVMGTEQHRGKTGIISGFPCDHVISHTFCKDSGLRIQISFQEFSRFFLTARNRGCFYKPAEQIFHFFHHN